MKTQTREMWDRCWDTAETDTQKKYDFLGFFRSISNQQQKKKKDSIPFYAFLCKPNIYF